MMQIGQKIQATVTGLAVALGAASLATNAEAATPNGNPNSTQTTGPLPPGQSRLSLGPVEGAKQGKLTPVEALANAISPTPAPRLSNLDIARIELEQAVAAVKLAQEQNVNPQTLAVLNGRVTVALENWQRVTATGQPANSVSEDDSTASVIRTLNNSAAIANANAGVIAAESNGRVIKSGADMQVRLNGAYADQQDLDNRINRGVGDQVNVRTLMALEKLGERYEAQAAAYDKRILAANENASKQGQNNAIRGTRFPIAGIFGAIGLGTLDNDKQAGTSNRVAIASMEKARDELRAKAQETRDRAALMSEALADRANNEAKMQNRPKP